MSLRLEGVNPNCQTPDLGLRLGVDFTFAWKWQQQQQQQQWQEESSPKFSKEGTLLL